MGSDSRRRSHCSPKGTGLKPLANALKLTSSGRSGETEALAVAVSEGDAVLSVVSQGRDDKTGAITTNNQTPTAAISALATAASCLEDQQKFVYDLLTSLDRRRSAVDSRCAVVFAISGVALSLFIAQMKPEQVLYHKGELWRMALCVVVLVLLFGCVISGLGLIAPISRSRAQRRELETDPPLSWFYLIADSTPLNYYKVVANQTRENLLWETCRQVVKISRLLQKRYDRLEQTCRLLYAALATLGFYVLLTFVIVSK